MTQLFALSIDASADVGNALPQGERKPLLVLANASSEEEAVSISLVALADGCWTDAQLKTVGPLSGTAETIEDRTIREAAIHARTNGCALLIF